MVLVTGSNGFVGSALSDRLRLDHVPFRSAVRTVSTDLPGSDSVVVGAVHYQTNWQTALNGITTVIHLIARVHVMSDTARDPRAEFCKVNVEGTLNLARQAIAAGVRRFIFMSSVKVNGEATQPGHPFTEQDPPNPQDLYAISKYEAEQGLRQLTANTGMEVVIIRPPLVYGPGVKANFSALMRAVQHGWPLPLGMVNNKRSLLALDNLIDFIITCITHPQAANQTFVISDGQDLSSAELVLELARAAGVPARLLPVPLWALEWAGRLTGKGDAVQRLCGNLQIDSSKARKILDWKPIVSVQEGLRLATIEHAPS